MSITRDYTHVPFKIKHFPSTRMFRGQAGKLGACWPWTASGAVPKQARRSNAGCRRRAIGKISWPEIEVTEELARLTSLSISRLVLTLLRHRVIPLVIGNWLKVPRDRRPDEDRCSRTLDVARLLGVRLTTNPTRCPRASAATFGLVTAPLSSPPAKRAAATVMPGSSHRPLRS